MKSGCVAWFAGFQSREKKLMSNVLFTLTLAPSAPMLGRLAFAGVFGVLIVWLLVIPSSRLMVEDDSSVWWKRSRTWAVIVATSQMLIYLFWS
jgi:hypothetical protein